MNTLRSSRATYDESTDDPDRGPDPFKKAQRMRDEMTQRLVVGGKCTVNFMVNIWLMMVIIWLIYLFNLWLIYC